MSLLKMSFSGTILILVILLLRAVAMNKLPKKTFLALWDIAILRLLLPFSVPTSFSIYSLIKYFLPINSLSENFSKSNTEQIALFGNRTAITAAPIAENAQNSISFWGIIWLIGMLICAALFTVSYFKCRREFQMSLPFSNAYTKKWLNEHQLRRSIKIRQSDRISTPLTYGVFRPIILLPKNIDLTDKEVFDYILAHEYVHIRRFDTLTKLTAAVTLCIHWFNPIVWIMYLFINRDIEVSCDEAVVHSFGESARSAYAMAIIKSAERKSGITPLYNSFSKNAIEERITAIMKFKKSSFISVAFACALVFIVGAVFATSANGAEISNTAQKVNSIASGEVIVSYKNDNGELQYSDDGGNTFFDEDTFQKKYSTANVEWWTYEEYRAWLENEKEVLQGMLGEKAYTNGNGNFIWTQKMIDETIAAYEKTLQDIKSGIRISKTVDGSEDIMLAQYDDSDVFKATEETDVWNEKLQNIPNQEYINVGIEWNQTYNAWFYKGKLIAALYDQNGSFYSCDIKKAGENVTYVKVVRDKKGTIKEVREVTKDRIEELVNRSLK